MHFGRVGGDVVQFIPACFALDIQMNQLPVSFSVGKILNPSPGFSFVPMISENVGIISKNVQIRADSVPDVIRLCQDAIIGTRMPPSYKSLL